MATQGEGPGNRPAEPPLIAQPPAAGASSLPTGTAAGSSSSPTQATISTGGSSLTTPTTATSPTIPTTSTSPSATTSASIPSTTAPTAAPTTAAPTTAAAAPTTIVTITPTVTNTPSVVIITSTSQPTNQQLGTTSLGSSTSSSSSSSDTAAAATASPTASSSSDGGLSPGGRIAIAVVIPIVVVALAAIGLLFFLRKRKQRHIAEEQRRAEVEEYQFNPNKDPSHATAGTAVGAGAVGAAAYGADGQQDMRETGPGGYRGWGNIGGRTNTGAVSPGANAALAPDYAGTLAPHHEVGGQSSPSYGQPSEAHSNEPMLARPDTADASLVAPLGGAPLAASNSRNVRRGPSNASSSYSMGKTSEVSNGEQPRHEYGMAHDGHFDNNNSGHAQNFGGYGEQYPDDGQAIQRDTSGRRISRNDNLNGYQQNNSGIAMNF